MRRVTNKLPESEDGFQGWLIDRAHTLHWTVAHFRAARVKGKDGDETWRTPVQADGKGFPDLVLVRDRVIYVECGKDGKRLSPAQVMWRDALLEAGAEWYMWTPKDRAEAEWVLRLDRRPEK
jgi:hypothetical protein